MTGEVSVLTLATGAAGLIVFALLVRVVLAVTNFVMKSLGLALLFVFMIVGLIASIPLPT